MKIIPLSEGSFTIDKTKLFVPYDDSTDDLQARPVGSLLVEIQPFLVITDHDIFLLDTGLGFEKNGVMQIHNNIRQAGIDVSSITKVLMSHLHKDHAGGVGVEREGMGGKLAFPNATYYIQRAELEFAFEKGFPSYLTDELECLRNAANVELIDGEGKIGEQVRFQKTGAHSPHHQVFWIEEGGEIIFFGGDDAPQLQQMKHRFVAKYDFDGKKAMELRRKWWEEGEKEKWTFVFYHDVKNASHKFQ